MGNNAVKTIVMVMVLVVLSFIVGAQISDSVKGSTGAFALIAVVAVMFVMLLMGSKSWVLSFYVPVVMPFLPFQLEFVPPHYAITFLIGIYWVLMWMLGHARFKWHSLPILDIQIAILFLYMAVSFYRHPVTIKALGLDYDFVGGKDYVICIWATMHYVILSALPIKFEELLTVFKRVFYLSLGSGFYFAVRGMLGGGGAPGMNAEESSLGDTFMKTRFSFFSGVGSQLFFYVYCRWPLERILNSSARTGIALFGVLSILVSGWRTLLISMSLQVAYVSLLKREVHSVLMCACVCYAGLLGLSGSGVLLQMPEGMQRVVSIVPGMTISQSVRDSARDSSEIRKRMWKDALNPRTGLIKDYVWGDGYQASRAEQLRDATALMRGKRLDMQDYLSQNGQWHNAFITFLHRLGVIGLVIIQVLLLSTVVVVFQAFRALAKYEDGVFGIVQLLGVVPLAFGAYFMVFVVADVFFAYGTMLIAKLLYCHLRDQGRIEPLFMNRSYVPMIIREQEAGRGAAA